MKRILMVVGTRPEAIKMLPLLSEFQAYEDFKTTLYLTGQHRELLKDIPIHDLCDDLVIFERLVQGQSQFKLLSGLIEDFSEYIKDKSYDLVLVQGDTSSAALIAWLSFLEGIPVWHIEAGLRTHDLEQPFPEEGNRRIISSIASFHFASTEMAKENLLREGIHESIIAVTGNTVVDALDRSTVPIKNLELPFQVKTNIDKGLELVLVTVHRRENIGTRLVEICQALLGILNEYPNFFICLPVHPNPEIKRVIYQQMEATNRVVLLEPVPHETLIKLIKESSLIMTDSGGIQEEAPSFKKPVLILRDKTERPEAIAQGFSFIAGTTKVSIMDAFESLQNNYLDIIERMNKRSNPFGDGHASTRIAEIIRKSPL